MLLTSGQVSVLKGRAELPDDLPAAKDLLTDRSYDANRFLKDQQETTHYFGILSKRNRKKELIVTKICPGRDA
jgi:hypothetical protein